MLYMTRIDKSKTVKRRVGTRVLLSRRFCYGLKGFAAYVLLVDFFQPRIELVQLLH
jgi:hypothetical protein